MFLRSLMIPALLLLACSCSDESASGRSGAQRTEEPAAPRPAAEVTEEVEEAVAEEGVHEAAGLRVQVHEDGSVTVTGDDRWGTHVETTYADAEYYRNAVEVLERNFTSEQAAALQAALEELPAVAEPDEQAPGEEP